jgi:carbon-monoxide dehydrogenase medium subunit
MYNFNYHRPSSVSEAVGLISEDAKILAGGQSLLPTMKLRLAQPSDMIDLGAVPGLSDISVEGSTVTIGATATHASVAASQAVAGAIPALAKLASGIGDAQVRNMGTIGGSVANSDPAADYPAAVLGLGATIHTNSRTIAADDFFTGIFETALAENEIITKVSFPVPQAAAYIKFVNPASRFAIVGVFVARTADGVRVAVTGAGPSVFRVPEMEAALNGNFSASALDGISIATDELNSDLHATAEYRGHLVTVMAKRAVQAAGG